ncbi:IclR family transcriptional regulator [Nitratireductor sp. GZWM139]|uniref:IclR family transcriptional regulator n=1 Tax=Nitratireductor sp. GZWM139 TaxID=2950541 RepID=UPI0024BD8D8C|nr:IclR family transcriptional regulator [Nitratireductor sp. GZWM139]MDJ1466030.1 IclR family transcriptional regulator [Nitratireductor sp. GZWM139]
MAEMKNSNRRGSPKTQPAAVGPEALQRDGKSWLLTGPRSDYKRPDAPGLVPAVENAIAIIEMLNRIAPQPASLAEISTELGISRSHCHSILKTLTAYSWLLFNERAKDYQLDLGVLPSISSVFRSGLLDALRQQLDVLGQRVQLPLVLSRPQRDEGFILVDKFNAAHQMEVSFPIGHRYPRDAVVQMRAFLAWQPAEYIDQWFAHGQMTRYTRRTIIEENEIRAELSKTRERGYARSDEEFAEGLLALALPVFDHEGNVAFIINCTSPTDLWQRREEEVARELILAVENVHTRTGARLPDGFPRGA